MTQDVMDRFSLAGKTAVMTGGSGLYGRQIAKALAQAGARTFMASRNTDALQKQADAFAEQGLNVEALRLDQQDPASCRALLDELTDRAGSVDVLVNNAVLRPMANWDDDEANWAKSMAVNATGLFVLTRVFADHMAAHGGGSIVNIGSIQGAVGPDYSLYEGLGLDPPPDYYFHKGGMTQLTRFVAAKAGPKGVRCNIINPGGFFNNQDPEFVRRYNARTLLGRMANESDLMGAVVFLASDASAYITGAVLPVDGGYTAK